MSRSENIWFRCTALASSIGRGQAIAIALMSVAISAWLIGPQVFHAAWGMIDDHDTFSLIGAGNHRLPPSQFFHVLFTQTEMGSIGHYVRFRPFYYLALLGEAVLWGDNVHLWYACRVGLLAIFIAGIWVTVARYLGFVVGLAVVLVVMREPYWGDVWARLGTSEIYGAAGLGLWLVGIERMFTSSRNWVGSLGLLAVSFGTFMMLGSKETQFPFVGYSLCAIAIYAYIHRDSYAAKIHFVLVLVYGGFSAGVIALALSRAGQDFLGRPVGLTERFTRILAPLGDAALHFLLPAVLLLGLTAAILLRSTLDPGEFARRWARPAAIYCAGVALIWSLYLFQFIAYDGVWPTGYRYDFPGRLTFPAMAVISVVFAVTLSRRNLRLSSAIRTACIVGSLAVLCLVLAKLPLPLSKAVQANIEKTTKFQETLHEFAKLAQETPQQPIVLRVNGAWAYEKIVSVTVYLRLYYKTPNKIAVKFYPDDKPTPMLIGLGQVIKAWEEQGQPAKLVPLASVLDDARRGCLSIGFDGPAEPGCRGGFEL